MSKRPRDIDALQCCAPARTDAIDWSAFLSPHANIGHSSPIDTFYESQSLLVRSSAAIDRANFDGDVLALLAGQLFLGYVSATELYLRQAFAAVVDVCPIVRALNQDQTISFGALDFYDRQGLSMALTEQVSFTEVGKIRSQLKTRLGVDVQGKNSLERAIEDFENACQLRHALIHSHGRMNSRNSASFLGSATGAESRTAFDIASLDDAASVSVNLVREVNLELMRHVLWVWIQGGEVDSDRRRTRRKISRLIKVVGSARDIEQGLVAFDDATITDAVMSMIAVVK